MTDPTALPVVEIAVSGAPGAVWVRIGPAAFVELTPGQALRHAQDVTDLALMAIQADVAWEPKR